MARFPAPPPEDMPAFMAAIGMPGETLSETPTPSIWLDTSTDEIVTETPEWTATVQHYFDTKDNPPPPPTREQVDEERDRRIGLGVTVALAGPLSFTVDSRDLRDFSSVNLLSGLAQERLRNSKAAPIKFRDAANTTQTLTPAQFEEMVAQVGEHVSAIADASWILKDTDPIPDDYKDDSHWPLATRSTRARHSSS